MKKFQELYASDEISMDEIKHSFRSWLGHARQAHTYSLRRELLSKMSFKRNG